LTLSNNHSLTHSTVLVFLDVSALYEDIHQVPNVVQFVDNSDTMTSTESSSSNDLHGSTEVKVWVNINFSSTCIVLTICICWKSPWLVGVRVMVFNSHFQQYFCIIVEVSFIGGEKWSTHYDDISTITSCIEITVCLSLGEIRVCLSLG
jgi:hypothetical protein